MNFPIWASCLSVIAAMSVGFCGQVISIPAKETPTIQSAMITARVGDTIVVANGLYKEKISVKPGVILKSQSLFGAVIDGSGRGTVVTLSGDASLVGFEIRNGTIGIQSSSIGNNIVKCLITGNGETGLMCAGRMPKIQDDVIVFNRGSGIQGWDVIASNDVIDHNTIAYNANNGIAFGGASSMIIENNIVAFNQRFGVKTDESVRVSASNNDFFQNGGMAYGMGDKNFSLDPKFSDPKKKMDFSLQQDTPLRSVEMKTGDIGARLAY